MSGDVVKVGQVWAWDDGELLPFTIVRPDSYLIRYNDGLLGIEWAKTLVSGATLVSDVPDLEPTPLDALAAAAVAYCDGQHSLQDLVDAAIAYARSVRG